MSADKTLEKILRGDPDANIRFEMILWWSKEDDAYVVDVPELA
jgi:hypothetical protein